MALSSEFEYSTWVFKPKRKKEYTKMPYPTERGHFSFMKYVFDKERNVVREAVPFYVPHKWWRRTLNGLRPIERCLLISLHIWGARRPSIRQLARELSVHRNTIKRGLKKLEKWGLK